MGLDFTLYEVTNYDYNNIQKEFEVKEVLYLSNDNAMLVTNWLYRNHHAKILHNHYSESHYFKTLYGYELENIYENLKIVLSATKDKQDLLALFYFPCLYTVGDWISNVEMFSDYYYADLEYLYTQIEKLLKGDNAKKPDDRYFLYNITW